MMKKLIFILFLLPILAFGQNRFPSIDSAKNYVLRYVKNSAVESFTNLRMQNVTFGTLQLLDSLCGSGVIDTIWKSGDTLKYRIGTQTVTVGVFSSGSGSTPTLQQVTTQGNSTTDSINVVDDNGNRVAVFTKIPAGGSNRSGKLLLSASGLSYQTELNPTTLYFRNGSIYTSLAQKNNPATQNNTISLPDSSGTLPLRIKLNSSFFEAANNGTIDLGTITSTTDSSIFATRFWVNSTFQPIGDYLTTGSSGSLQSLTITGTNGNGHIHLRHQASLPTATGQSTVIYANSNGDFAYKNDGNYHTTFLTSANTADRSYTFQNKSYTVADNAEVVKYTDTLSMLDGRISSITLNTSGAIHTNPITFSRIGGAWSGSMSLTTQSANTVFAGPTTGSAATPTFRALVDADLPSGYLKTDSLTASSIVRNKYFEVCEFLSGFSVGQLAAVPNSAFVVGGGVTSASVTTEANRYGLISLTTTQTQTQTGYLTHGSADYLLSSDTMTQEYAFKINDLSDSTGGARIYNYYAGNTANLNTITITNGLGILYNRASANFTGSNGSPNWQIWTASASSRTFTTSSVAVTTGWHRATIISTTGWVQFWMDGVLLGTITNNVPTVAMHPIFNIRNVSGTLSSIIADFYSADIKYSTTR